jgi:predicted PurR-regulated permease PerM
MANRRRKRNSSANPGPTSPDASHRDRSPNDVSPDPAAGVTDDSALRRGSASFFTAMPSLARILSVVMLILGIVAVGVLFYRVMAGFFVPLFLAVLLVLIFRPVHQRILQRVGNRPRLAALATTMLIMLVVLAPILAVISVATSQFTAMVSQINFDDLTNALERMREQIGISLKHPEQFRRLDALADTLSEAEPPDHPVTPELVREHVNEALMLIRFLQDEEPGVAGADVAASVAEQRLEELNQAVSEQIDRTSDVSSAGVIRSINAEEQFHRKSVTASAAIRTWMREFLGGTFRSQVRLMANPSAEDFKSLLNRSRQSLQPRFVTLTSATGTFVIQAIIGLVVLVIALYFFLIDGAAMIRTLMRLSPLDDHYEERLLMEFDRTSRAVVLASVASALAQGVLAAIAFYFLDFHSVIFLFLITSLMALVPFLGAASVWVPSAIYLGAVEQRWTAAIVLALFGATVISSIDNVIKMYVLHGRSTMHPLFALLSVLGGVKVFGPIGILVGPMVVVFLQTLLEILNHELAQRDASEIVQQTSEPPPTIHGTTESIVTG